MTTPALDLTDEEIAEALDGEQEYFPAPSNPMAVARRLLPRWTHKETGLHSLRHWRGQWMRWERSHWRELAEAELTAEMYRALEHAEFVFTDQRGDESVKPWAPTKGKVSDVLAALAAIVHLSERIDAPSWFDGDRLGRHSGSIVACGNGLLDLTTRRLHEHTPAYFNTVAVPFDYDPGAADPHRWLAFLGELWPDGAELIGLLQEVFGYMLSGRTDLQKIALLVGPSRSGKGTIARVLRGLVGSDNVAGPTLASLGTNFGLSGLLGKSLAIVSDARIAGRDRHLVVERLLTISGEDTIDVDRKYRPVWTGKLGTRMMILSNELPDFGDASGAIANRFRVLRITRSWLGKEDPDLTDRLLAELPGILNWALDGLTRIEAQGRLSEPAASRDEVVTMQELGSPVAAFLRECCTVGQDESVTVDRLWERWKDWCEDNGHAPGTKQIMSRNLAAASAGLRVYRPHGQPRRYSGVALRFPTADEFLAAHAARQAAEEEPPDLDEPPAPIDPDDDEAQLWLDEHITAGRSDPRDQGTWPTRRDGPVGTESGRWSSDPSAGRGAGGSRQTSPG
jgi:putative DNA primase/helicase